MECKHLRIEPEKVETTPLARVHYQIQPICELKESDVNIRQTIARQTNQMLNYICPYYNSDQYGQCPYQEI
ncbi:MAG: hypothetical protein HQ591_01320 [candidate division Zixibacteria bacterium]|nr:hypothetical protein [Candidatus Tariuqbacter arcticus]